jgi:choline dehydrogenase-like flavoprotein
MYGAALYRLRKENFGVIRHHEGMSPAWLISYNDMESYYSKAERLYQVHGARGEDPTESPASAPYPDPPGPHRTVAAAGSIPWTTVLRKGRAALVKEIEMLDQASKAVVQRISE